MFLNKIHCGCPIPRGVPQVRRVFCG